MAEPRGALVKLRMVQCREALAGLTYAEGLLALAGVIGHILKDHSPDTRAAVLQHFTELAEGVATDLAIGEPVGSA